MATRKIKSGGGFIPLGGNAAVSPTAPIQPPQAFVDCALLIFYAAVEFDLSGKGIVDIDPELLRSALGRGTEVGYSWLSYNLANNALSQSTVDGVLAALAADNIHTGVINLSGGTNAFPTPASMPVNGEWSLDVASMVEDTEVKLIDEGEGYAQDAFTVLLSSSMDFADSVTAGFGYGQYVTVGVQDNPSQALIAEYVSTALGVGLTGTVVSGTFVLDYAPNVAVGPISGSGPGMTIDNPGVPYAENANIWTLYNNGWTVRINDPQANPVTYTP